MLRIATALVGLLAPIGGALGQDAAKPAPAPDAAARRASVTFEELHVTAGELPKEWRLEEKLACVSPQAELLVQDSAKGAVPPQIARSIRRKDFQTIAAPDGRGSLLFFDCAPRIPADLMNFLPALLYGDGGGPSRAHPELLVRAGSVLVIVSLPATSAARDWCCERLRQRFGLRVPHRLESFRALLDPIMKAFSARDADGGLKLLKESSDKLAALSLAAYVEGELRGMKQDWDGAEKAYARARELDATSDPLPDDGAWFACAVGRSRALKNLKRYDEALPLLREAARFAAELGRKDEQANCLYLGACSLALAGRAEEAVAGLRECIALAPGLKSRAKVDAELTSLQQNAEFRALVQ